MAKKYTPQKQRYVGIILAVLFGPFGWLYTYKFDAWKFWLNLAICIFSFGMWGFVAWIWAVIDMCIKDERQFTEYYG